MNQFIKWKWHQTIRPEKHKGSLCEDVSGEVRARVSQFPVLFISEGKKWESVMFSCWFTLCSFCLCQLIQFLFSQMQSNTPSTVGLKRKLWVDTHLHTQSVHKHTRAHSRAINKSETNRATVGQREGLAQLTNWIIELNKRCEWRQVLNQSVGHKHTHTVKAEQGARPCTTGCVCKTLVQLCYWEWTRPTWESNGTPQHKKCVFLGREEFRCLSFFSYTSTIWVLCPSSSTLTASFLAPKLTF